MVLRAYDDEVEWRSPEAALALDLSLVEDVFRRLARARRDAASTSKRESTASSSNQSTEETNPPTEDDGVSDEPRPIQHYYRPDLVFSKSDVLVTLEKSAGFLQKRPLLRKLHTALACVSLEKEGASVEGFVRYRVKERTVSFAMARDKLVQIHAKTQSAIAFEKQLQAFTEQVRAESQWCVRDWKSICKRPSQFYGIHVVPAKPKTQKQLEMEQKVVESLARSVVSNAVQLAVPTLVDQVAAKARPVTSKKSDRRTPHNGVGGDEGDESRYSRQIRKTGASKLAVRPKAKREQAEAEARRKEVRLQIFAPSIEKTHLFIPHSASASPLVQPSKQPNAVDTAGSEREAPVSDGKNETRAQKSHKMLLLLATIEANGDLRIAQRLLAQKILHSGFQRALDQSKNLGLAPEDQWGLVKIWKSVYRNHTMQALQSLPTK